MFTSFLQDGKLTIALTGDIDHHSAKRCFDAIASKIEVYTPKQCDLDFSEVAFMDSSGIAVIINAFRAMTKIDGVLTVSHLQPQPMRVLHASGVDRIVAVREEIL